MKYLITGGTGLIGRRLIARLLEDGHEVHNLSRSAGDKKIPAFVQHKWDGKSVPDSVPRCDVVVNMAGAGIAEHRWTEAYKQVLVSSRVDATKACADYLRRSDDPDQVLISASGYNYYGDLVEETVTEQSPAGDSFMAGICKQWESAASGLRNRTAIMRICAVLAREGGPLAEMLKPYKFFVGGPTGTGRQGFPWIHIDDLVSAICFIAEHDAISGPVNMAAPQQITQKEFSDALASQLARPNIFRLGRGILSLVFGEMSVVLWGGARVVPAALQREGFEWKFPEIAPALADLLGE